MKAKSGKARMKNNFDTHSNKTFDNVCNKALDNCSDCGTVTKIYFAAPWFDERANKLYETCQKIYHNLNAECKTKCDIFFPKDCYSETPREAFDKNVKYVENCDVMVALVSRKDCGTSWEIGMAYALNKPVYLLGYDETTFLSHTNLMLAFTGKCITLQSFPKLLSGNLTYKDYVNIENIWEGIE